MVTIDRNKVTLWDSLDLTITVSGGKLNNDFKLPDIVGFKAQFVGQSSRVSFSNQDYQTSFIYTFRLFPLEEGSFVIPSIGATIDGNLYTSNPIEVSVVPASEKSDQAPGSPTRIEDKVFMTFETTKQNLYLYEQTTLVIRLYWTDLSLSDILLPNFDKQSLVVSDPEKPRQFQEIFGGVPTDVIEFKVDVYPTKTGKIDIGPAFLGCNVLYRRSQGRAPSKSGLFSEDFFNSIFDRVEAMPIRVQSKPLSLNVSPLPPISQDQSFSGGVGDFNFDMSASPQQVKVGDPITVRLTVTGNGSFERITIPQFIDTDSFKVYEPLVKEDKIKKTSEQVLLPTNEKIKEIPAVTFTFFNPAEQAFKTITKGPIPIKVLPPDKGDEFKVFELTPQGQTISSPEKIGTDLIYIKETFGRERKAGEWFYQNVLLKIIYVILCFLYLALFVLYLHVKRLKTDVAYARRMDAPKKAKEGIQKAAKLLKVNDPQGFYEIVSRTLREFIGDKLHVPAGGITSRDVPALFKGRDLSDDIIGLIQKLLEKCDEARFASVKQDKKEAKDNLVLCEKMINHLEKTIN